MKKLLQAAIVVLITAAAGLLSTGSAQAAPTWQTYTKTSKWLCKTVPSTGISTVQSCIIVNGNAAQAVVIVTNNTSDFLQIQSASYYDNALAVVSGTTYYTNDRCDYTYLGAGLTRACFGRTITLSCSSYVQASVAVEYAIRTSSTWLTANGPSYTRKMCSS